MTMCSSVEGMHSRSLLLKKSGPKILASRLSDPFDVSVGVSLGNGR